MDDTLEQLQKIARSWLEARNRCVQARNKAAEAAIFAADQGTHSAFLQAKATHDQWLAGIMSRVAWSPQEIEALSELMSGWNSQVGAARASIRGGGLVL